MSPCQQKRCYQRREPVKKLTYRVLEEVVRLDMNKIWGKVPNIFTIINNANLREDKVREVRSVQGLPWCLHRETGRTCWQS